METILNTILNFALIAPSDFSAYIIPALMIVILTLLFSLSWARGAVGVLIKKENKNKAKAAISAWEILLTVFFALCAFSLVKSPSNVFSPYTAVLDFGEYPALEYAVLFLITTFLLVICIEIPSRVFTLAQKEKFVFKTKFFVKSAIKTGSLLIFSSVYAKEKEDSDSEQISVAIDSGNTKIGEKEILKNILQFGDTQVKEIMTPRHDIVAIEQNEKYSALKKLIVESNFSRIPVFEKTPDNIYGIIYVKDLLKYISMDDSFDWTRLVKKISYVSENKKISDLLKVFQQKKIHMAVVSNEYGGISGLITMQDILEEIVGEISDEFDDNDEIMFKKISETHYIFDGKIMLSDFYKTLNLDDDFFQGVKGDAESLAGVLLEMRGEFPQLGEKIPYKNLVFITEAFNNRRIEKISVKIISNPKEEEQ